MKTWFTRIRNHRCSRSVDWILDFDLSVVVDRFHSRQLVRSPEKIVFFFCQINSNEISMNKPDVMSNIRWSHTERFDWMSSTYFPNSHATKRTSIIIYKCHCYHCVMSTNCLLKWKNQIDFRHYYIPKQFFVSFISFESLVSSTWKKERYANRRTQRDSLFTRKEKKNHTQKFMSK